MSDMPETPSNGDAPPPPYSQQIPPQPTYSAADSSTSASGAEERNWAMAGHLSALVGLVVPLGNVIGPLVVWQMKKDTMPFAADQAKEALNFNITAALAALVAAILMVVLIGFLLMPIIVLAWLILTIMAGIAASKGENYRYPFALRLIN